MDIGDRIVDLCVLLHSMSELRRLTMDGVLSNKILDTAFENLPSVIISNILISIFKLEMWETQHSNQKRLDELQ